MGTTHATVRICSPDRQQWLARSGWWTQRRYAHDFGSWANAYEASKQVVSAHMIFVGRMPDEVPDEEPAEPEPSAWEIRCRTAESANAKLREQIYQDSLKINNLQIRASVSETTKLALKAELEVEELKTKLKAARAEPAKVLEEAITYIQRLAERNS